MSFEHHFLTSTKRLYNKMYCEPDTIRRLERAVLSFLDNDEHKKAGFYEDRMCLHGK